MSAPLDELVANCVGFLNDEEDAAQLLITIKPAPLGGKFAHAEVIDSAGNVLYFHSDVVPLNPPPPEGGGN